MVASKTPRVRVAFAPGMRSWHTVKIKTMITAHKLAKYYGAHAAVQDLSFAIAQGEVVGLLGLNGAGKTTTLRILSGLLIPTSGTVQVGGISMTEDGPKARRLVGFLPETPPVYPEMHVGEFLRFVARIKGVPAADVAQAVAYALAATDLTAVQHARIGALSHGYGRRIGIAQAIVHKPALILLDEPTGGLDPVQVVHMRKLIRSLRGAHTLVVSSHLLSEMHALCDRIIVLGDGRVLASGTEAELAARLGGQAHVHVQVRGTAQAFAQALAALPQATVVRLDAPNPSAPDIHGALVALAEAEHEVLAAALVHGGLGLRHMQRQQVGLENTFLRLLGHPGATSPQIG